MSGKYFVSADEDKGARWSFTAQQVREAAGQIRPGTEVAGQFEPHSTLVVLLPREDGGEQEVTYHGDRSVFVFREEDAIRNTAGFVLNLLQRLAPDTPCLCTADFDDEDTPFRPAGLSIDEFVREIWGEPV